MTEITIYTDGSAHPNPGPGGWGAIILKKGAQVIRLSGFEAVTTNNRMELKAAAEAVLWLKAQGLSEATIYSDSQYVVNSFKIWAHAWEATGWKKRKQKNGEILNLDLIRPTHEICSSLKIDWRWIKGHNGNFWNEQADMEAETARKDGVKKLPPKNPITNGSPLAVAWPPPPPSVDAGKLRVFLYKDFTKNKQNRRTGIFARVDVVFTYTATSILDADKAYESRFGYHPETNVMIGCQSYRVQELADAYLMDWNKAQDAYVSAKENEKRHEYVVYGLENPQFKKRPDYEI